MKKHFLVLLTLSVLALAWSCTTNDDTDRGGTVNPGDPIIPSGWVENKDYATMRKKYFYLHRSGNDSIIVKCPNYINFDSKHYVKGNNGKYTLKKSSSLFSARSIQKGNSTQIYIYRSATKKVVGTADYKMLNENKIIFYNLPEIGDFGARGKTFDAVSRTKKDERSTLEGGWYYSSVVDSTVLAFERGDFKEYLFVRGTSNLVNSWDMGKYSANNYKYVLGDDILSDWNVLGFMNDDKKEELYYYELNPDHTQLTIYWASPGKTTTYTKIKK